MPRKEACLVSGTQQLGWPHEAVPCAVPWGSGLGLMLRRPCLDVLFFIFIFVFVVVVLTFSILFEEGALYFRFTWDPYIM